MKSLDIVNEMLNYPFEERILTELATNETIMREEELQQIKQDLDVLEILKNKNINVGRFKARFYISSNPHQLMRTYNCDCNYIDDELSIDEVIKLKQWLEGNAQ